MSKRKGTGRVEPEKADVQQTKHHGIRSSIVHLERVLDRYQDLLNQVVGSPASPEVDGKASEVTLTEFLDHTSGRIDDITSEFSRIRDDLQSALF